MWYHQWVYSLLSSCLFHSHHASRHRCKIRYIIRNRHAFSISVISPLTQMSALLEHIYTAHTACSVTQKYLIRTQQAFVITVFTYVVQMSMIQKYTRNWNQVILHVQSKLVQGRSNLILYILLRGSFISHVSKTKSKISNTLFQISSLLL